MRIVVDSREKAPFQFLDAGADIEVVPGSLQTGDYSVRGFENEVACERKELSDLVGCLGSDRERFLREIARARGMRFVVVVEAAYADLAEGRYRSKLHPASACASVAAIQARYGVPFMFAGSRDAAERFVATFLRQFLKGKIHAMEAARDALQGNMPGQRLPVFSSCQGLH